MKILVIRFSSIGDIVLTTPVIRCIKQQLPGVKLHYLTKESFKPILSLNPWIDKLITIKENVQEVANELKKEKYDHVIDLHHNLRSAQVKSITGAKSNSLSKLNIEKWLAVNFKWNILPDKHIVDRYLETASALGVKNDGKGLEYFFDEQDHVNTGTLPEAFKSGFVVITVGAGHSTKQLPPEKMIALILQLQMPCMLLGGTEDQAKGEVISAGVKKISSDKVIVNGCGKYSLNQSASLIKQASCIIAHDTGLMHIAAAFKKKIVSVWGNTIPQFGMSPYFGNHTIETMTAEVRDLSCRPCTKIGYDKCPKGHFKCMNEQDLKKIAAFVNS